MTKPTASFGVFAPQRRRAFGATVMCAVLLCGGCQRPSTAPQAIRFTPIADGVEYARFRAVRVAQSTFDGHAFRIDLEGAGLRLLPAGGPTTRREVAVIARAYEPVVAINASFFDEHNRAMGTVIDQGRTMQRVPIRPWGALVVEGQQAKILAGSAVKLEDKPDLVVQGTPRLLVDGEIPKLKRQEAERTAVCADGSTITFVVVTTKVDAAALADFLRSPAHRGGLSCRNALNLDGGPSSQLDARLGELTIRVAGGWGVPNALVALPGLPARATPLPPPTLPADVGDVASDPDVLVATEPSPREGAPPEAGPLPPEAGPATEQPAPPTGPWPHQAPTK